MTRSLEEIVVLNDGREVKVHGGWAVDWRRVRDDPEKREEWLEALTKIVNERRPHA